MTHQEKQQRNTEIAKMLWGKPENEYWVLPYSLPIQDLYGNWESLYQTEYVFPSQLQFDSNYHWIMIAVDFMKNVPDSKLFPNIIELLLATTLEELFTLVSDFAKEYNKENGVNI